MTPGAKDGEHTHKAGIHQANGFVKVVKLHGVAEAKARKRRGQPKHRKKCTRSHVSLLRVLCRLDLYDEGFAKRQKRQEKGTPTVACRNRTASASSRILA
jgi:hypothetical protein